MKTIRLLLFLSFLSGSYFSCINKSFLKKGIISYQTYFTDYDIKTELPLFNTSENRIWFKDNSIIYEIKIIYIDTENDSSGEVEKVSFVTHRYTYLDLNTMRCQDYFHL